MMMRLIRPTRAAGPEEDGYIRRNIDDTGLPERRNRKPRLIAETLTPAPMTLMTLRHEVMM